MLVYILIFITIILSLLLLSMVWPLDSPWSPWWATSDKVSRVICRLAKVKEGDVVYDLGCGEGKTLITAAKEFKARGVGVEIDPFRAFIAYCQVRLHGVSKNVTIQRKNFFAVDISEATVIYMYLIPKTINKLKLKIIKECKPGTRVVSFVYKIDLPLIASDTKHEVYVYEIPKGKH